MMIPGLLVIIVVSIIVWQWMESNLATKPERKEKRKGLPQTAQDILDERYANGEISREEYLTVLKDIETEKEYRQD